MIECSELIQTRDYLLQQFQSCAVLDAEDMQLLVDFAYSLNQCNSSLTFVQVDMGTVPGGKTFAQVINESPTFTIEANQLVVFRFMGSNGVEYKFLSTLPAGDYGVANPIYTDANLILIFKDNLPASSISVAFAPLNYNPAAANVEEHLKALDLKLSDLAGQGNTIFVDYTDNGLVGVQDGVNTLFTVSEGEYLLDILIFLNGQLLWEDNGVQFTDAPNGVFEFEDAPLATDEVLAYYRTIASSGGGIQSVVAGTNISVDNSDPANPVVSTSGVSVTDGDKGDILVSNNGVTWMIKDGAVDLDSLAPEVTDILDEIDSAVQPGDLNAYALLSGANFSGAITATNMVSGADPNTIPIRDANGNFSVVDQAYAPTWNGNNQIPTKNAIYDKIESLGLGGTVSWANITDKPATFPPSAHTHSYGSLSGVPASFPPSAHTHPASQITDFNTVGDARWLAYNGKAVDSDRLDNLDSTAFLRSNAADVKDSGELTFNNNIELRFGTTNASHVFSNGTHTYWDLVSGDFNIRNGATPILVLERTTGDLMVTGQITADSFFEDSDIRLKQKVTSISPSIVSFEYKDAPGRKRYGAIAQTVLQKLPELVEKGNSGMYKVNMVDYLCTVVAELENSLIELWNNQK